MWNTRQGFTLIELSVVLVIIGLIVGGVLVGQNLISAAAVRAQITQIEKYNTAVNTFRNKYGGIPGDLSVNLANQFGFLVPSTCTGAQGQRDGNGLIDGTISPPILAGLMGENALFWEDLTQANLLDNYATSAWSFGNSSNICSFSVTTSSVGNYIPPGLIGYSTYVHAYETAGSNWYMLANIPLFSSGTSAVNAVATIPVILAYNIDKKIDDGIPTTGNVQAVYINGSRVNPAAVPNSATDSATTCYNNTSNTYSIEISNGANPNCALSFRFQ